MGAQAQPTVVIRRVEPSAIAAQIYAQLPDLPLENTYRSSETGAIATDSTLVSRLIRYHLYTKDRPANFRFDWKLTVADYLGAFEPIRQYPSAAELSPDSAAGDIAAMAALTRTQRNQLVQALYDIFTGGETGSDAAAD
ncbi:MAG: hypothetical protein F6J97_00575 [Leptolyngbya sp. SIO4C1]|nr:hypothetical protein [Leptolyngbya sp. SIO4C1]